MLDESYQTEKAELRAGSVGVPSGKKRAFLVGTTTACTPKAKENLQAWRRGVQRATGPNTSLGDILGRNGTYFLKEGAGERGVFMFEDHMLSTTKAHETSDTLTCRMGFAVARNTGREKPLSLSPLKSFVGNLVRTWPRPHHGHTWHLTLWSGTHEAERESEQRHISASHASFIYCRPLLSNYLRSFLTEGF